MDDSGDGRDDGDERSAGYAGGEVVEGPGYNRRIPVL